ncbi:GGDEF domain protein [Acidisarcina polymorpha]|uniref:diguanylate cyclase n=1 Tax=Acidisarcina polymorpha TaxID=2211140 RepID=A0A2Z5G706_9BACT|nr:diguanylate cyclase [Acidisarcina polymorpha]AXC14750.1 GGDEF domain protein [Acidisarcina polymorpha]
MGKLSQANQSAISASSSGLALRSRILVGAADSLERSILRDLLADWGYQVITADDGAALLEALNEGEPAPILIVDNALAGLDGVALLHQFHWQSSRCRCWTIALTDSSESPGKGSRALARGIHIDDFLTKPVNEFDLRVSLHAAFRVRAIHAEMLESVDAARFHASRDSLTGLWNRESLLTRLFLETDRAQRMGSPLAFLLFDLDHFSLVNQRYGYDGGDNILRQFASRLRRHLRSYDLAGRCGEDEFLIAMPGCSMRDAWGMAQRLQDCIRRRPFDILKASVSVTASFGIAQSGGRSPLLVLREAESTLRAAKQAGGDCVRCFPASTVVHPIGHSATPGSSQGPWELSGD